MVKRKRHLTLCLFILWGTGVALFAQEERPQTIALQFSVLPLGKGNFHKIKVESEPGLVTELSFSNLNRSETINYHGPNPIRFFREKPAPTESDPKATKRVVVATYDLSERWDDALLMFKSLPTKNEQKHEFTVLGIDDSPGSFPRGSIIAINATNIQLIARMGKERLVIPPGPSPAFSFLPYHEDPLLISIATDSKDGPKLLFENSLTFAPDSRVLLIMKPPRKKGSLLLKVYSISEIVDEVITTETPSKAEP
ncbi:MAG: hypothetical protein AAFX93_09310 [Verrucomicrobiota bacterium]